MHIHHCRVCEGSNLTPILDLGTTALANRFLRADQLDEPEPKYPLRAVLCGDCGLVQIDENVPREVLFKDYIYVTGTSDLAQDHAAKLARDFCSRYRLGSNDLVVEAASNDGTVLKAFREHGVRILGVEPATNIATQAAAAGVPTVVDFFDGRLAKELRTQHGPAQLFIARHVLAHVTDLQGFVAGIKHVLAPDGVAVIECPHLATLYDNLEFDTIYHEHLCYFSLGVLKTLFARVGLQVIDVDRVAIHGGSLLVQVAHADGPHVPSLKVTVVLKQEENLGLDNIETWHAFDHRVERLKNDLLWFVHEVIRTGRLLVGYGAPAKGNTLLAYCGIGPTQMEYIVDRSPHKQGLFTPGHHIPVYAPERMIKDRADVALLLAWNFAEEVARQQVDFQIRGGRFAVPLPEPRLYGLYGVAA